MLNYPCTLNQQHIGAYLNKHVHSCVKVGKRARALARTGQGTRGNIVQPDKMRVAWVEGIYRYVQALTKNESYQCVQLQQTCKVPPAFNCGFHK